MPSTETDQGILQSYDSTLQEVIKETIPTWDSIAHSVDSAILLYILNTLTLQMASHSRAKDDKVVTDILGSFFHNLEIVGSLEDATLMAYRLLQSMKDKKILAKRTDNIALAVPLNMKKASSIRITKNLNLPAGCEVKANVNSMLNWDTSERSRNKLKKNHPVEDPSGVRGQSREDDCVVWHRKERLKGNEDEIHCPSLTLCIGKNVLLENADLHLYRCHKYGLVGKNGSGKTSLFRLIADREAEGISPFVQILHVEQEITKSSKSPIECILETDVERTDLLQAEKELLDSAEPNVELLQEITEKLDSIDANTAELRVKTILRGLSFTNEMMQQPVSRLSGGWRMRVALAKALFVKPDILFLDEPTNHLDLHAVLWLQSFLGKWNKTLMVVSHDRSFLNAVCKEIIHLENRHLVYYKGNYDAFEKTRLDNIQQHQREYEAQEKAKAHMQTFITRFRCTASRAAQVQSRVKALERLSVLTPLVEEAKLNFDFPSPKTTIDTIIQISDVSFRYPEAKMHLFQNVNTCITNTSRMGIVGPNGSGKSTFLQLLVGILQPTAGHITIHAKARVGMFTQHHVDSLNLSETPLEAFQNKFGKETEKYRQQLSRFGLRGSLQLQPVYTLSGGQKSRLAFALIMYREPDLLILDEPTNHLDIETVNALIEGLIRYKGGVVLVSHDEHLINNVCTELWTTENGTIKRFDSDFTNYKARIMKVLDAQSENGF